MTVSRWIECSYKRALGDPTSADALRHAFYHQIVHDVFKLRDTGAIASRSRLRQPSHLDSAYEIWNSSINVDVEGLVIGTHSEQ